MLQKWRQLKRTQLIHIICDHWLDDEKFLLVKCKSHPFLFTQPSRYLKSSSLTFQLDILSSLIFGRCISLWAVVFVKGIKVLPRTSKILSASNLFSRRTELTKESVRNTEKFPSRLTHSICFAPKFKYKKYIMSQIWTNVSKLVHYKIIFLFTVHFVVREAKKESRLPLRVAESNFSSQVWILTSSS